MPAATETTSSKNGVVGVESVDGTVFHADGDATNTVAFFVHQQVGGKVLKRCLAFQNKTHLSHLNEIGGIVVERSAVKSVEERVTSSVSDTAASVGLTTLSVFE